jgi:hypothetical protein
LRRKSVVAIDAFVNLRCRASQQFGDENEGEGALHVGRRVLKDVGDAHADAPARERIV